MEKVSLEALLNPELSRGSFRYILKNMLAEGSEEGASDLINYFADDLYDLISGQEASKWHEAINNYRAQGYTESEAFGRALADRAGEVGFDMLGGALSGEVMAGGSLAINAYQNGTLVKEGLKAPEGSEIRKTAEQIRAELNAGQKVSQAEYAKLGQLIHANTPFRDILNTELNEQKNSASEAETGSTVINTNPAQHTPAEQKVIDEYQAAVDENLVNFVETSISNKGSNKGRYTLKPVSKRATSDIKSLTGVDTTGFKTVLEARMAEHIIDRHGKGGKANNTMSDINDIGRMQYVIDNYDRMEAGGVSTAYTTVKENGRPKLADTVRYIKAVDGTYYVVEAVPNTKARTAFIVSAYLEDKNSGTKKPVLAQISPTSTPESAVTSYPATQTIPQTSANSQEGNAAVSPESSVGAATRGFADNPSPGEMVPSQNKRLAAEAVPLDCQQGKGTVTGYDSHTAVAAQACAERRYGRISCYAKADDKGAGRSGGDSPTARRGAAKAAITACRNKRFVQNQGSQSFGTED